MKPVERQTPAPDRPPRRYVCDLCGCEIDSPEANRFVVTIDVRSNPVAAAIREEDLKRDFAAEITRLIREMESMSLDEIEDGVHRAFRFDLCPACKQRFLDDPLGKQRLA